MTTETERRQEQYRPRRNNLTNEDLDAISAIVEATYKKRQHGAEDCRFGDILPEDLKYMVDVFKEFKAEDLKDMVDAFKEFKAAMADSKKIVRRFIVVFILTSISGAAIYGWWTRISDAAKQAVLPGK